MIAQRPNGPADAPDEPIEPPPKRDLAALPPASVQDMYDAALERTAADDSPALLRYMSVLLAAS